jgi:hypothetical protein
MSCVRYENSIFLNKVIPGVKSEIFGQLLNALGFSWSVSASHPKITETIGTRRLEKNGQLLGKKVSQTFAEPK